ncbi:MAG: hypothetical protein ACRD2C_07655 [Acidimicrobiales bacterium]
MSSYITRVHEWFAGRAAAWRADGGAITTETAVVTFLLVGVAIAVVALIQGYASDVVNAFPDP